jgi:hypothetical protein
VVQAWTAPFSLHYINFWYAVQTDGDVAFVCLWIPFNAAYAQDMGASEAGASERQAFRNFMSDVCRLDEGKALSALVWQVFPGPIRVLLDNP